MFLIVATCVAIALLITKGLLGLGVTEMWIRYAIALIAAYGTFFIGVWVWLHLSKYGRYLRRGWQRTDWHGDVPLDIPSVSINSGSGPADLPIGGGGAFDGGGASGGWDQAVSPPSLNIPYDSSSSSFGDSISNIDVGIGDLDVGDEGGGALVIAGILLAIVLIAIFGAATYAIYQAPAILAEVVFEVLLGSPLARGARAMDSANWVAALFRKTWIAFGVLALSAMAFALFCNEVFPTAKTIGDVLKLY
jgi:hypothetical protein